MHVYLFRLLFVALVLAAALFVNRKSLDDPLTWAFMTISGVATCIVAYNLPIVVQNILDRYR